MFWLIPFTPMDLSCAISRRDVRSTCRFVIDPKKRQIPFYIGHQSIPSLKILEICSCFPPSRGGVERCVYELSSRFAGDKLEVSVVTSTRGKEAKFHYERIGRLNIIRHPERFHIFEAPLIPMIATAALTADYDILHVHGMSPTITELSILFAKLRRKPVVLTYHNDAESVQLGGLARLASFVYSSLVSPIIRLADVVVCSTLSYAKTSVALRYSLGKLQIIPMGVDSTRYDGLDLSRRAGKGHNILFVGQLKDYKGVEVLLEAIFLLQSDSHNVSVNVVGTGPELQKLKRKVGILGIEKNVKFLGNVSDEELSGLYASADTVVLPSLNRREAFGIVLLEAIAAGRNVVASDIPGVSEVAIMAGGFLAQPNDARSLSNAILNSIHDDRPPEMIREIARNLSWDKLASKYETLFENLQSRGKSP